MSKNVIDTWHAVRPSMEFDNTTIVFVPTKAYLHELSVMLKTEPDICSTVMTARNEMTARFLTFTAMFIVYDKNSHEVYRQKVMGRRCNIILLDPVGIGYESKEYLRSLAEHRGKSFKCISM